MTLRPIDTLPLFPELSSALLSLLDDLTPQQWRAATVHRDRDVKDLVAHLLDTTLRRLAMQRDGFIGEHADVQSYSDLVRFIQHMNRTWMDAARRLSPRILTTLLRQAEVELFTFIQQLDPGAEAIFPVAWAGEQRSVNWFDIAREYTEKWHHQQQIRDALGKPALTDRTFMHPVIDTFIRAAPHAYRNVEAARGTAVRFDIQGDAGGTWLIQREESAWHFAETTLTAVATVQLEADIAWRLWTKDPSAKPTRAHCTGPEQLCLPILHMVTIMA
jgi:uncharacterized protein (TIGR03083 family)